METIKVVEADYPTIFSWNENTVPLADEVYECYLQILLDSIFSTLEEQSPELLLRLKALPAKSLQLILEAPETYERLNTILRGNKDISWFAGFLDAAIDVEHARNGNITKGAVKKWSANGDIFIDYPESQIRYNDSGWLESGWYSAKKINHIPIDYSSIYARAPMPVAPFRSVKYGDPIAFTPNEGKEAEDKILEAYFGIEEGCPSAASFISKYVKAIIVRKNSNHREVFQSASRNAFVGQIVFLNPHAKHVDVSYIAESLVHEAIHSLMWRQEILSHFLIDPSKDMGTAFSPWSGEEIYYYTMLQAVFVWYGIAFFWRQAIENGYFPKNRAEHLFQRSLSGFYDDRLLQSLSINRENLQHGVFNQFKELVKRARELE